MNAQSFLELSKAYDNIIFDYGGIFVDIDYQATVNALQQLTTKTDVSEIYGKKEQVEIFDLLETGKISADEFIDSLAKLLQIEASLHHEIKAAWNAMLKEIHPERVAFLRKIVKEKRVFMLSNINIIHEEFLQNMICADVEHKDFYSLFEEVHFSHKIGMRKPELDTFKYVLDKHRLKASDTLFLDDSSQHVKACSSLGVKSVLLDPANSFIAKF